VSDAERRATLLRTVELEAEGLAALRAALEGALGAAVLQVVSLILGRPGRVIVTGMGKSGHVGRKIAATLASTGTPALFVHPAEASHGDLGMITREDSVWRSPGRARRRSWPTSSPMRGASACRWSPSPPARERARQRGRPAAAAAAGGGGLPERARADHQHDDAARARRRAGDVPAGGARLLAGRISATSTRAASSAPG
jgi:hypothetical protein